MKTISWSAERQVADEWAEVNAGDSASVFCADADGSGIGDTLLTSVTGDVIVHTSSQSGEEGRLTVVAATRDEGDAARDHQASNWPGVGGNQFSR